MNSQAKHRNRLIHATSPYLLQHADNPIDWYEWGKEAFAKAKSEDRPILLSIGYAACHWCHVMAHETFEDEQVAGFLNEHFVCIKVDREERPDVDEIYMQITQMLNNGHGGWPMTLFLTPDRRPFFAGTYFPRDRFLELAKRVQTLWVGDRSAILTDAAQAQKHLDGWAKGPSADESIIAAEMVGEAAARMAGYFDPGKGGFRTEGNKFPPSMTMDLMLRVHHRTGEPELLAAVEATLKNMARGGIYDHLGGGICRYSTDPDWLVPHFEKMLYDQALVGSIYVDAFLVTKSPDYADVARGIFDYVIEDLQSPAGGFYSTRDADSEGLEGAYYIWTVEQVKEVLGGADADLFCKFYDVTARGNWFESRGHAPAGPKNILHMTESSESFAESHGLDVAGFERRLAGWRDKMLAARANRVPPSLDDKILTGWNGLMIASLAKGARALDEPKYTEAAGKAADFVLEHLRKDGRLLRSHRNGVSHLTGYLSDYAFMIEGLLNLYEATFERRRLDQAAELARAVNQYYRDEAGGGFFFTASDAEKLIARTKNPRDGAIPSGNSVQAMNLLRLSILLNQKAYRSQVEALLKAFGPLAQASPASFERLLCAVDMYHSQVKEVAIVGGGERSETDRLVKAVFEDYRPNKVVAMRPAGQRGSDDIPLLAGKVAIDGKATAYVCEGYVCKKPVTRAADLKKQLDSRK